MNRRRRPIPTTRLFCTAYSTPRLATRSSGAAEWAMSDL